MPKFLFRIAAFSVMAAALGWISMGCTEVLPFGKNLCKLPQTLSAGTASSYSCGATIYRDLPGGKLYREAFETTLWASTEEDPSILCSQKADGYISAYLAPGFAWKKQDITVSAIPPGAVMEGGGGADCSWVVPQQALYGGPKGSFIDWLDPSNPAYEIPPDQVSVSITQSCDVDGPETVTPKVSRINFSAAERTGVYEPLFEPVRTYVRGARHLLLSEFSLVLEPFELTDLTYSDIVVHSISSVPTNTNGQVPLSQAKFYVKGKVADKDGNSGDFLQCFSNDEAMYLTYSNQSRVFSFNMDKSLTLGKNNVRIQAFAQWPMGTPFWTNQPFVSLPAPSKWQARSPVDLTPYYIDDPDEDLAQTLWFENFEDPVNEKFLGEGGLQLPGVTLAEGTHEITVVAYDLRGAHATATSTLTVLANTPPVAFRDFYRVTRDVPISIPPPGVLQNDTDAEDDPLIVGISTSAEHGVIQMSGTDGAFSYFPPLGYTGRDSFQYKAWDGRAESDWASVLIEVVAPPAPPGDVNGDGTVDCADVAIIKASFGKKCGQAGFDARADVVKDCTVDLKDLAFVSQKLPPGTKCP